MKLLSFHCQLCGEPFHNHNSENCEIRRVNEKLYHDRQLDAYKTQTEIAVRSLEMIATAKSGTYAARLCNIASSALVKISRARFMVATECSEVDDGV